MSKSKAPLGLLIFMKESEVLQNEDPVTRTSRIMGNWLSLSDPERQKYHQRAIEENYGNQEIIDADLKPYFESDEPSAREPRPQLSPMAKREVDFHYIFKHDEVSNVYLSQWFNFHSKNTDAPKEQTEIEISKSKQRVPVQSKNKLKKSMKGKQKPDPEKSKSKIEQRQPDPENSKPKDEFEKQQEKPMQRKPVLQNSKSKLGSQIKKQEDRSIQLMMKDLNLNPLKDEEAKQE